MLNSLLFLLLVTRRLPNLSASLACNCRDVLAIHVRAGAFSAASLLMVHRVALARHCELALCAVDGKPEGVYRSCEGFESRLLGYARQWRFCFSPRLRFGRISINSRLYQDLIDA